MKTNTTKTLIALVVTAAIAPVTVAHATTLANQERTASQAVSLIQTVSNHVDSVEKNASHANTNATAALHMIQRSDKAIVSVTEAVQGQQLEQMNRDRTANQRVQPVVGHDGADGKDGVTTVVTRVETDTVTQDQVKANTKAIAGTEIELLGESNLRRVSDLNLQHQISATNAKLQGDQLTQANRDRTANQRVQPVVGHDGADGKNGIDGAAGKDGINGADGKDGVTTVVTRVETDTVTQDQVSVNSNDLKGLQLQQANRDRTAQQQVNNATSLRAVSSEQAVQGEFVQRQATVINQHSARIDQDSDAIAHNSQRIDQNAKRIDETKEDLKRGLNNAAAMSSLHFNGNRDSWALSTGSANGEGAALAGGMQKSLTEHTAVTVQYSDSLSGGYMVGAGIHGDW
ncbi:hypothetical protein F9U44_14780 [Pectobacterium versatile]|uniref:hypothetical protein n=1 Tax=Pectobacterium versatile TaxID=2488639 RepID=UPI001B39D348|nr:hypothetical protein [Pectobacterium versatile]MBQ4772772.1 hypothetical protein [Pectobacterium versatile]